jgi:hypothetical protein
MFWGKCKLLSQGRAFLLGGGITRLRRNLNANGRTLLSGSLRAPPFPYMNQKPFKSRVCALSFETGYRLCDITASQALALCDAGLAYREIEVDRYFVKAVTLMVSDDEFRSVLRGREKPKGNPRPSLKADSSTGDAGRGLGALLGHRRVLHYGPGIRA